MYDCIIVGGGPGGASAAYHLAKTNRNVLLLEKASLPRFKPCTGAVSPSVAEWFDFDFTPAIDSQIQRVRYTWKLEDAVDAVLETEPIWSVRREIFDQYLLEQAQRVGAAVRDRTPVLGISFDQDHWQVDVGAETLRARYLVAADGAAGPMADWLGFKPHKLRAAHMMEVETGPVEAGAFWFEFGMAKNGCLWRFPRASGYALGGASFIGGDLKRAEQLLSDYAEGTGLPVNSAQVKSHPLKLWDGNRPLHTRQAVVVGEAAAIVDPLTAEGVRPAMFSGMLAAKALNQAIAGNETALADYSQQIHQQWGADMQWAQRIATVFFRVPKIGYRVGIKRPTATKRLGQILAGEVSYADIASRVTKRITTGFLPGRG